MIFRCFPDHTRPGFNLDAPCPVWGWPNMIIHAETTEISYPEHLGPLSIKCAFRGREFYRFEGASIAVDDSSYLILNDGQRYASHIRSESPVETFCVFFRPGFSEEVRRGLVLGSDRLLDDPACDAGEPVTFIDRLYPHNEIVTPALLRLRAAIAAGAGESEEWLDEQLRELVVHLLEMQCGIEATIAKLPAARPSTRRELYRRLERARSFMESNSERSIDLTQVAGAACLSPHHFLRLFKQAYHETPHQYLTRIRLERAQNLLRHTTLPVKEICRRVGFESPGSFSWLFRRRVGMSPNSYRRAMRDG